MRPSYLYNSNPYPDKATYLYCDGNQDTHNYLGMDGGLLCGICFLDIENCFNTINHSILLKKLECNGIKVSTKRKTSGSKLFIKLPSVQNWRFYWNFIMQNRCSTRFNIGPLFLLIYVSDFCKTAMYLLTDTILDSFLTDVEEVKSHLQLALNSVENWYLSNLLSLSKERSLIFSVRGNKKMNRVALV